MEKAIKIKMIKDIKTKRKHLKKFRKFKITKLFFYIDTKTSKTN
jgi:hypothetical protein